MEPARLIRDETVIASPLLCPELRLHLVTPACRLWRATERDLERLSLPPPYWAFAWPGGQALARYVLDHPELVRGKRVLDFGAGGGIEALAAARAGARSVLCSDLDPFALEAIRLNARENGLILETTGEDLLNDRDRRWEVILAGDVCYDREAAAQIQSWLAAHAASGTVVLIGDPDRGYLDRSTLNEVGAYDAPADIDADGSNTRRTRVYRLDAQNTVPEAPA